MQARLNSKQSSFVAQTNWLTINSGSQNCKNNKTKKEQKTKTFALNGSKESIVAM